jgi:hypothetical protein
MLDGDGTYSNTHVPAIRCEWVLVAMCPVVPGIKCHRFVRSRLRWCLPDTGSPQVWLSGARACPELGDERTGLTGGEILPAHGFRDRRKCWCGLLTSLVYFRLVVPPFQP